MRGGKDGRSYEHHSQATGYKYLGSRGARPVGNPPIGTSWMLQEEGTVKLGASGIHLTNLERDKVWINMAIASEAERGAYLVRNHGVDAGTGNPAGAPSSAWHVANSSGRCFCDGPT